MTGKTSRGQANINKTIKVDYLARVEGEGALYAKVRDNQVKDVRLNIFEPPRFFEAFLRGRDFTEVPDITARICGICPVAYQMSAVHAMETACGVTVPEPIRQLRRLLYCGEWIESHTLHVYMLHAPDFLGYEGAIEMAADHGAAVEQGLKLKKTGNDIVNLLGGREIHPINVKVGGFYRIPRKREFTELKERLEWAREAALATVRFVAGLDFPDLERDYEFVSVQHETEYPFSDGRLVSNKGLDAPFSEFREHFEEVHVEHSTALHCQLKARGAYLVGPLARYSLGFDKLTPLAQEAAREAGLGTECRNPYQSIVVRSVEILYAVEEALRIVGDYVEPEAPAVEIVPQAGVGCWATEAPRGMLFHRYRIAEDGSIQEAQIVPPTSQNQDSIEDDLRAVLAANLDMPEDALQWRCEQTVRNYDPCISCSVHFLKLELDRA